jgi:predicted Rossmann-fold nucleotide-binding protein
MEKQQLKIVGVMGSGSQSHAELARVVGTLVAGLGCHLLTGGGGGIMAEASRAFCGVESRKGFCIGIIKGKTTSLTETGSVKLSYHPSGPNEWVEIPIFTHLPLSGSQGRENASRNHINVLSSDVLVVLPGSAGTYSEVTLRIDYGKKVIFYLGQHDVNGYPARHFLSRAQYESQVSIAESAEELERMLKQQLGTTTGFGHL